ncbi:hypothetical protein J502_3246 [Acinetobacter sp. 1294596]|nr:hypothetical protein J502_3246 [Acinetobacter sp. 1294596]
MNSSSLLQYQKYMHSLQDVSKIYVLWHIILQILYNLY